MRYSEAELEKLSRRIDDVLSGASRRTQNALKAECSHYGLRYVAQLLAYTERDFLRVPNMGKTCASEVQSVLREQGYKPGYLVDYREDLVEGFRKKFEAMMDDETFASRKNPGTEIYEAVLFTDYLETHTKKPVQKIDFKRSLQLAGGPNDVANWLIDRLPKAVHGGLSVEFLTSVVSDRETERRVEEVLVAVIREKLAREGGPA